MPRVTRSIRSEVSESFPDEGGNSLRLKLTDAAPRKHAPKLHGFWDGDAVMANLPQFPDTMPKEERQMQMDAAEKALTDRLAKDEPKNWRMPAELAVEKYPEAWANDILPLAREAHARLRYQGVKPKLDKETMVADGEVVERGLPGDIPYRKWSAGVVLEEMHKAGWRLAALLEKALAQPRPTVTPTPSPNESVATPPPVGRDSVEPGMVPVTKSFPWPRAIPGSTAESPPYRALTRSCRSRVARGKICRFPIHRHPDAGAATRVIEENKFFERTRIEFAVGAEFQGDLRESIGLTGGVDPEGIGLALRHSHCRVRNGSDKEKEG